MGPAEGVEHGRCLAGKAIEQHADVRGLGQVILGSGAVDRVLALQLGDAECDLLLARLREVHDLHQRHQVHGAAEIDERWQLLLNADRRDRRPVRREIGAGEIGHLWHRDGRCGAHDARRVIREVAAGRLRTRRVSLAIRILGSGAKIARREVHALAVVILHFVPESQDRAGRGLGRVGEEALDSSVEVGRAIGVEDIGLRPEPFGELEAVDHDLALAGGSHRVAFPIVGGGEGAEQRERVSFVVGQVPSVDRESVRMDVGEPPCEVFAMRPGCLNPAQRHVAACHDPYEFLQRQTRPRLVRGSRKELPRLGCLTTHDPFQATQPRIPCLRGRLDERPNELRPGPVRPRVRRRFVPSIENPVLVEARAEPDREWRVVLRAGVLRGAHVLDEVDGVAQGAGGPLLVGVAQAPAIALRRLVELDRHVEVAARMDGGVLVCDRQRELRGEMIKGARRDPEWVAERETHVPAVALAVRAARQLLQVPLVVILVGERVLDLIARAGVELLLQNLGSSRQQ